MLAAIAIMLLTGANAYENATPAETRGMDAIVVWHECLIQASDRLSVSREAADIVTEAVLGSCEDEQAVVRERWFPIYAGIDYRTADTDTDEAMKRMRSKERGFVLSRLVTQRANQSGVK